MNKTLKDMKNFLINHNLFKPYSWEEIEDYNEAIRGQAIVWIKYYRANHRQGNLPCEALMIFLNITEDELI